MNEIVILDTNMKLISRTKNMEENLRSALAYRSTRTNSE